RCPSAPAAPAPAARPHRHHLDGTANAAVCSEQCSDGSYFYHYCQSTACTVRVKARRTGGHAFQSSSRAICLDRSEPHSGSVPVRKHNGAPDDLLRLFVDGAELTLAQQHLQHGDQLSHREARAQTTFDTASERNPRVRLWSDAEEPLGTELFRMLVSV